MARWYYCRVRSRQWPHPSITLTGQHEHLASPQRLISSKASTLLHRRRNYSWHRIAIFYHMIDWGPRTPSFNSTSQLNYMDQFFMSSLIARAFSTVAAVPHRNHREARSKINIGICLARRYRYHSSAFVTGGRGVGSVVPPWKRKRY